jgi:site-specific recombinase XerD
MKEFEGYLQKEGLALSSIEEHKRNVNWFEKWVSAREKNIALMNYNDVLEYVQYLKESAVSVSTINIRLNTLRKYYEFLKKEGRIELNPARHLHIKGRIKKVVVDALSASDFDALYAAYSSPREYYHEPKHRSAHQRDIVIVGLLLWQGMQSQELRLLEKTHINLKEGTIYIPSTGRSNRRELRLDGRQILTLQEYLKETTTEKLFECNPYDTMQALMKRLKKINPEIRNAAHLRASVILEWLKRYNKREVQYMAGHRHLSSTEYYQVQELSSLTEQIKKHHPGSK